MYMVWLWGTVTRLMQFAGAKVPGWIIILFVTIFPLQGFFNMIVYFFPRICRYFERGTPVFQSFRSTVGGGLPDIAFSFRSLSRSYSRSNTFDLSRSTPKVDSSTVEPVEQKGPLTRDEDPFPQEESEEVNKNTVAFADLEQEGQKSCSPDAEKLELNDVSEEEDAIDELALIVEA